LRKLRWLDTIGAANEAEVTNAELELGPIARSAAFKSERKQGAVPRRRCC
jgi:hypothetical protein